MSPSMAQSMQAQETLPNPSKIAETYRNIAKQTSKIEKKNPKLALGVPATHGTLTVSINIEHRFHLGLAGRT